MPGRDDACARPSAAIPSSVHARGPRGARRGRRGARGGGANWSGAKPEDVIFTSGATESNALALCGRGGRRADRRRKAVRITRLFVSAIEHSSVLKTAAALAERSAGVRLEMIPVTADGVVDTEALRVLLREGKGRALVAVMAANNETGVIQPMARDFAPVRARPARCCWSMR